MISLEGYDVESLPVAAPVAAPLRVVSVPDPVVPAALAPKAPPKRVPPKIQDAPPPSAVAAPEFTKDLEKVLKK